MWACRAYLGIKQCFFSLDFTFRHTQNISLRTRLWNQKLPHRQQQQQSKRPSSYRAVKKEVTSISGWMDTCFRKSVSYKILNNLEISCMSFIKHCCLDEYDMSNSCILNCYCSFWGKFTRDCLLIIYLRLLVSAVTMCKIIFWSRLWEHYCANGNFINAISHAKISDTTILVILFADKLRISPILFVSVYSIHFMFSRDPSQLFISLLYSEVEPKPS